MSVEAIPDQSLRFNAEAMLYQLSASPSSLSLPGHSLCPWP
jgi:hypothetical protein